jgi:hypothetical protein
MLLSTRHVLSFPFFYSNTKSLQHDEYEVRLRADLFTWAKSSQPLKQRVHRRRAWYYKNFRRTDRGTKTTAYFSKQKNILRQSTQKKPHSSCFRIYKTNAPHPQHGWYATFSTKTLARRLTQLRSPCNENKGKSQHPNNNFARLQWTTRQWQPLDKRNKNEIGRAC